MIAFGVLPIRGVLYTLTASAALLVAIQTLDGIGAAIFGVVSVLVIADLTRGTNRFNLTLGAMPTAVGRREPQSSHRRQHRAPRWFSGRAPASFGSGRGRLRDLLFLDARTERTLFARALTRTMAKTPPLTRVSPASRASGRSPNQTRLGR